jgi:hypothetical protein
MVNIGVVILVIVIVLGVLMAVCLNYYEEHKEKL